MDSLSLQQFLAVVNGTLATGSADGVTVRHVATHAGRLRSGAAFFALAGTRTDGHDYLHAAADNGAVVVVAQHDRFDATNPPRTPVVLVHDPLRALQDLAAWWRQQLEATVVAVTGSNGKTITKDALVQLTSSSRNVYGSPGSYNSQLGVALSLLECPIDCELAVVEVAVTEPGEMAHLERMVRPDAVVVTNVGHRWRSNFEDIDEQTDELFSLAGRAPLGGWLLLGDADERQRSLAARAVPCPVHVLNDADAIPRFSHAVVEDDQLAVEVRFPDGVTGRISVASPSDEILHDIELAVSAAVLLGVDPVTVLREAADHRPTSTRVEIWQSPGGVTLVRDVATPDPIAVGSAIRAAKRLASDENQVAVVLAEPKVEWDAETADDLALVISAEQVDAVFAFQTPSHRRFAESLSRHRDAMIVRLFEQPEDLRLHLLAELQRGDVVLVQSAPDRPIHDLSTALMESMAPTRLYLDLAALEENVTTFRRHIGPSVRIMGMVKALAYGTDSVNVSLCLQDAGVDYLGVSNADEGAALRRAGISLPILVMLSTGREVEKLARHRLTPLLYSPEMVDAVLAMPPGDRPLPVHLEVDTGMHRAGFEPGAAIEVLRKLASADHLVVEGVMTHLACADDPDEDDASRTQLARFEQVCAVADELGLDVLRHAAATAATIRMPEAHFDMVRVGLGLYGFHPSEATRSVELVPSIALVSRINQELFVPSGERVGYGGSFVAPDGGGWVGVVPAGYHDCIPRAFSNFGYVIVGGQRCPIVGTVSMDSMTIDLSACPNVHVGADVLIYGRYGDWVVPLEEVSAVIDTIPYEVMARVGPRVQRIFTRH